MIFRSLIPLRFALIAALLAALPAFGSILGTYEDRSTWNGLTTGTVTDDFESLGLALGGYTVYGTASGLTRGSINYVGVDGASYTMLAINPTSGGNYFGSGVLLRGPDYLSATNQYLQLTLPDVTSVGFDLGSAFPNQVNIRITLSTGEFFIRTTQDAPVLSFWGVQADTPISWIRIALSSGGAAEPQAFSSIMLVDNVSYGAVYTPPPTGGGGGGDPQGGGGEVPEATTLLYVGSGFLLLRMRRKMGLSIG